MACIKIKRVDSIRPSEESLRQPHPILCSFALGGPLQNNVSIRKSEACDGYCTFMLKTIPETNDETRSFVSL